MPRDVAPRKVVHEPHRIMKRQYPFSDEQYIRQFKNFFSPTKAPFWVAVGVGASAILGGVIGAVLEHRRRHAAITRERYLPPTVHEVELGDGFEVFLSFGSLPKLSIEASRAVQKFVRCETKSQRLCIYLDPSVRETQRSVRVHLAIDHLQYLSMGGTSSLYCDGLNATPSFGLQQNGCTIEGLNVAGARGDFLLSADAQCEMTFQGGEMVLSQIGSGFCSAALEAEMLTLRQAGEAVCRASGTAKELVYHSAGTSCLEGQQLRAEKATLTLQENAQAELLASEKLDVSLSDSCTLTVFGKPKKFGVIDIHDESKLTYI